MSAQELVVLGRFKQLLAGRLQLHKVILFGSRARGDADADSDMDVLVILDSPVTPEAEQQVRDCAWEAGVTDGIVVVPVTVSRTEWEEGPLSSSLLSIGIEQDGIAV